MTTNEEIRRYTHRIDAFTFLALAAFLVVLAMLRYEPHSFLFRDAAFYAQTNRSIAEELTLRQENVQPRSWYDGSLPWYKNVDEAWSNVSVGKDGEWYPKHSYLMPVFSTPFFVTLGVPGLLVFNLTAMLLGLFAGYKLATKLVSPPAAAVAVLLVCTAKIVPYLAYSYSFDVFYGALVAGGAALLAFGRPGLGALLLGLSLWAKPTNVVIALPLALALIEWDRRTLLWALGCGALPLIALALANTFMYGAPWETSYGRILVVDNGIPRIRSLGDDFDRPLSEGLAILWEDPDGYDLRRYAALPFLAYLGLVPLLWRRARLAVALLAGLAAFLYVFGIYHYTTARFFMPWVFVSILPLAALLSFGGRLWERSLRLARERLTPRVRRRVLAGVGLSLFVIVIVSWALPDGARRSPSGDLERLRVTLNGTPCDYLNMNDMKWECSRQEVRGGYLVGRAVGDECAFAEQPMLWVPPDPRGRRRVITWMPRDAADGLDLAWGLDETADEGEASFTVRVGDNPPFEGRADTPGKLVQRAIDGSIIPGTPVTIEIAPATKKKLFLCLGLTLRRS